MRKKLAMALSIVLALCLIAIPALAAGTEGDAGTGDKVAQVGEDTYATLAEAVEAANTAGTADITLLKDVTVTESITLKFKGKLDLGTHTLTAGTYDSNTGYNKSTSVGSDGDVTITNGTVTAATTDVLSVSKNGTLTLETNVTVTSTCPNNGAATLRNNGGTLNLNSGATIKTDATYPTSVVTAGKGVTNIDGATITVNGKDCPAVYMYNVSGNDSGTVNFKSGTITGNSTGKNGAVYIYDASNKKQHVFNMSGGTITGGQYGVQISGIGIFKMTGGLITNCGIGISGNGTNNNQNTTVNISGDAKIDVGEGNVGIYQPQNGTTTISGNAVISGDSAVAIKSGTLNINGGTLTAVGTTDGSHPTNGANLATDSSVIVVDDNAGSYYGHIVVNITGGTFTSQQSSALSVIRSASADDAKPQITISGGSFTSGKYGTESTEAPNIYLAEDAKTNAKPTITGGTFSTDVSEYLPTEAKALEGDNGGVVVYASEQEMQEKAVAKVETGEETEYFASLAKAVAAAAEAEADTVTLLNDAEISAAVNVTNDLTIQGAEGVTLTRASGNKGTFFTVADKATLTLSGVTIDAGGKWHIDEEKWAAGKELSLGQCQKVTDDPFAADSGNVETIADLIVLNGVSGLTLNDGTVIKNMAGSTSGINVIGVDNSETKKTVIIENAAIQHITSPGASLIFQEGGLVDFTLKSGAVLTDNFARGGNGGLFYLRNKSTLTMNKGAAVTNNHGVNCNGTFIMTYGGASFVMEGGTISGNEGLKGASNGYCQPVYAHQGGTFTMNGGEIVNNTGCYAGAIYQRINDGGKVELNGGTIKDNHYYGEDDHTMSDNSFGQVFLTDESTVGKDMTIDGDISIYGQAETTVKGTVNGNVYIFAEQQSGYTDDTNHVELEGTVNGDVFIESGANVTNSGKINGDVTVEPQDTTDKNHSEGTFTNSDTGTISGTVTLSPDTSMTLGEEELTAGDNGAEFTVDGSTVTLAEGTLKTEKSTSALTFKDSEGNTLKPAGEDHTVMIVVANVTCGDETIDFDNLPAAVEKAKELSEAATGEDKTATVKLLKDAEGAGIDPSAPTKEPVIVIDFNGKTYTLTEGPVGSSGTQTQGMRLRKGMTVTLKNGTLKVGDGPAKFLWLINNYANLTIDSMTLDGTNLVMPGNPKAIYTLSSTGTADIKNTRFIDSNSQADGEIFSIAARYGTKHAGYGTPAKVTIDDKTTFNKIYVERAAENQKDKFEDFVDGMMAYVEYNGVKYGIDTTEPTAESYIEFTKNGTTLTPVLPDSNLNYNAIADTSIVKDCVAQTMWVRFDEALSENTWLWFEITASDGKTYGIAGHADGKNITKMAWSFLNQGQFESWPDGAEEGIADGEVTVKCYVLPGKVTAAPETMYLAWTKTVTVSNVTAYTPDPVVSVDESLKANEKELTTAAGSTAIDDAHMNDLASEALTDAEQVIPTTEEAKEALGDGDVTVTDDDAVHIMVETYLNVTVQEYVEEGDGKKLTFDIQPMYQVVATTAENVEDIELGTNAVEIGDPHKLTVTEPVTMTLGVPEGFLGEKDTVYVQHDKNGKTYYYVATANEDNTITFTNPHGFSSFTVIVKAPEAQAQIGNTLYETLQDALDHVQDGETIEVLTSDALTGTAPAKEISFEIVAGDEVDDIDVTVRDNGNYHVTKEGNTYTVKYVAPVSPSKPAETTAKVEETEGGSVTLSSTTARAGETVTATLTPDVDMKADGLTVTDAQGNAVTVTKNEDGTYSFVMPAATPVTVKGAFVEDCPADLFPDIDVTEWYHDYADYVIDNGIMNGYEDGTFKPHDVLTRAELAQVLWNLSGKKDAGEDVLTFTDVKEGDWFYAAVQWASGEGIVNGYEDGSFKPDQAVTREELAVMLYRYAESIGEEADPEYTIPATYTDAATIGDWALEAMSWCVQNGIINGRTATTIEPAATAERCEVAAMLTRYLRPAE